MPSLPVLIGNAVICCLLGAAIGSSRGQGGQGAVLGLFLGEIGLLLCFTMKTTPAAQAARELAVEAERAKLLAAQQPPAADSAEQPAADS